MLLCGTVCKAVLVLVLEVEVEVSSTDAIAAAVADDFVFATTPPGRLEVVGTNRRSAVLMVLGLGLEGVFRVDVVADATKASERLVVAGMFLLVSVLGLGGLRLLLVSSAVVVEGVRGSRRLRWVGGVWVMVGLREVRMHGAVACVEGL